MDPNTASMVSGQPVNHVLHVLPSFFPCGLWLPVWLAIAVFDPGQRRLVVSVVDDCNITYQHAGA